MRPENAIEVHHVSKEFKVYLDKGRTLKEKVLFQNRRKYEKRIVLNDISFEIKKGEVVGLIGQNGCGKSTILKLLTRIMYPDSGSIQMSGRVSSLIELGAGFHPDMSGRENIYINASIFGLSRKDIDERLETIIEFSELGKYIDNPVRTYSSGMYMRLAFSVAINVNADILLIDEILAVGDANFQSKCFNKLREIKEQGTTIVIVSHSLGQIEQICGRSIWIHEGKIRAEGPPHDIHLEYLDFMGKKDKNITLPLKKQNEPIEKSKATQRWGNKKAQITDIKVLNSAKQPCTTFKTGELMNIVFSYTVSENINDAVFGIEIFRNDGLQCYGTNTRLEKFSNFNLTKAGTVEVVIVKNMLLPGEYWLDLAIESGYGEPVDYFTKAYHIRVFSNIEDVGVTRLEHNWRLEIT